MNFLKENEKSRIIFALNLLSEKLESGYKLGSLNFKDDSIIFSNGDKQEKVSIKKITENISKEIISDMENTDYKKSTLETTENIVKESRNGPITEDKLLVSETSMLKGGEYGNFSETSEMYEISEMSNTTDMSSISNKMIGGSSKNIFQKNKYSETSSLKQTDVSNFSATSTDIFNGRSDKYSDTSVIKGQVGGKNLTSDTLGGVSELKQRKVSKTESQLPTPKLDMGIFTKKSQSGGAVDNLKRRMMDVGINSNSSTSSICE